MFKWLDLLLTDAGSAVRQHDDDDDNNNTLASQAFTVPPNGTRYLPMGEKKRAEREREREKEKEREKSKLSTSAQAVHALLYCVREWANHDKKVICCLKPLA